LQREHFSRFATWRIVALSGKSFAMSIGSTALDCKWRN
jgi:hypothetical protein